MTSIQLLPGKKIFFASDFHLGSAPADRSRERERMLVRWLDSIKNEAQVLFLVGDIFDFWHEYKEAVPKGYVRFLGKLAELKDSGVDIQAFTGNHDLWMRDYFPAELGIPVHFKPIEFDVTSAADGTTRRFMLGHGDGLGPGDWAYKNVLKPIFTNPFLQFLFRWLHPDIGIAFAHRWARHTRASKSGKPHEFFHSDDMEWIFQYCREVEQSSHHDFYIFGHRHLLLDMTVSPASRYINIGEWLFTRSYGTYDGKEFELHLFENDPKYLIPANRMTN